MTRARNIMIRRGETIYVQNVDNGLTRVKMWDGKQKLNVQSFKRRTLIALTEYLYGGETLADMSTLVSSQNTLLTIWQKTAYWPTSQGLKSHAG
jgi:hypothetical protein